MGGEKDRSAALRPLLHIGYHKTATSWFQRELYPRVGRARTLTQDEVFEHILRPRALEFDARAARKAIAAEPGVRIVLCDEELSGNIHSGGLHGLLTQEAAHRLRATFPDGDVVVLLRSQVMMIAAAYLQYVRMGGTHRIDRYLLHPEEVRPSRAPLFSFGHFDYDRLLEHYEKLFGRERLHVYLYEDFRRDNAAFLERFCNDLRLDVDLKGLELRPRNVSYGRRTVALARLLNRLSSERVLYKQYFVDLPGFFDWSRQMLRRLDRLPGMGAPARADVLLGPERLAAIRSRFAPGNAAVAARYGLDLRAHRYPLPDAEGDV